MFEIDGWVIAFRWMSLDVTDDKLTGNGLVPSGNKPLPKLMLTHIYVVILRHKATMC